jgi:hypothetical protein
MNSKRATHYIIQSQTWIADLWGAVTSYKGTFDKYLEMRQRILYDRFPKTVPQYVKAYAQAYESAYYKLHTIKMLYTHEYEGNAYFKWDSLPEAGKELFRQHKGKSAHVWPGPECVDGVAFTELKMWGELKV